MNKFLLFYLHQKRSQILACRTGWDLKQMTIFAQKVSRLYVSRKHKKRKNLKINVVRKMNKEVFIDTQYSLHNAKSLCIVLERKLKASLGSINRSTSVCLSLSLSLYIYIYIYIYIYYFTSCKFFMLAFAGELLLESEWHEEYSDFLDSFEYSGSS